MVSSWSSLTALQKRLTVVIFCLAVSLILLIGFTIFLLINTDFRLAKCKKRTELPPPRFYAGVSSKHKDIVNDTTTTATEEFAKIRKFIVSLHYKHFDGRRVTFCVGSILTSKWLITSSLCVHQKIQNNTYARAGSLYHNRGGTIHKVVDFIIPDWRKNDTEYYTYRYFSLARVKTLFNIHGNVLGAVKLPVQDKTSYTPRHRLYTAGWGSCLSYTTQPKYEKLRIATSQMYSPSIACRNYMQADELKALTVIENVLCAGDLKAPLIDQCNIDVGAPLTHLGVIRGVSWSGSSCKNYPTVYAKGPALTTWYRVLARTFGDKGHTSVVLKKVALDQFVFAPTFIGIFLTTLGVVQGKDPQVTVAEVKKNYLDVLISNYKLWPWVQLGNFYLVPLRYQVLVVQIVAILWNTYLSWKTQASGVVKTKEVKNLIE